MVVMGEDLKYNPKCPCLAECSNHGFCADCLNHHDRNSAHPPLCMRNKAEKEGQRNFHWHPQNKDTKYYGDRD